ncbi:MAG: L,D-transpeptidase family protein [Planctomycetes bacterium]|nr:L,D-transpeptidase family protein [Planctomycetota bacterium]
MTSVGAPASPAVQTQALPDLNPAHTLPKLESAQSRYEALCKRLGRGLSPSRASLRVIKSARLLQLCEAGQPVCDYPVQIGLSPRGHKTREGDQRTPVGDYYICSRNPESRFHLFLGLSYPNNQDARAGLAAGLITEEKCREISQAIARHERPDWYTPLGGEVGIHGGGIERSGTQGCIALRDEDIEEVWAATLLGTPVEVRE